VRVHKGDHKHLYDIVEVHDPDTRTSRSFPSRQYDSLVPMPSDGGGATIRLPRLCVPCVSHASRAVPSARESLSLGPC